MLNFDNQRVAVFIDTQNMYYSARNLFGKKVNFGDVVSEAVGKRQLIRATAYVVSTESGEESPFFDALNKSGIQTKEKELVEYFSGIKKADWDVGITVDIMSILDSIDVIILVSGDGDFVQLAQYVKAHGRRFEVVSFRETTSSKLLEWADHYTNLSDDKRAFLIGKARRPPTHMTKGGEAFVEKDQAGNLSKKVQKHMDHGHAPTKITNDVLDTGHEPETTTSDVDDIENRLRRLSF